VLAVGFPGAAVDSADTAALELIHEYCTNMAGPLFTRIREELGLAYFVSATQFQGLGTGMFAFYLGTAPGQLDLARRELLSAIARLAENGIPEADLAAAKNTVAAGDALQNQSNRAMAQTCAINSLFGLGEHHHEENLARIRALTPPDVRAVAARYFATREPVIATVLPSA
jgi:zinc protease